MGIMARLVVTVWGREGLTTKCGFTKAC